MKNYFACLGLSVVLLFSISSCKKKNDTNKTVDPVIPICTDSIFNIQSAINDMNLAPDAALHGTEAVSWDKGEASSYPIPVPAKNWKGEWFQAITDWGQVYIPRSGSTATNTRCQIRNVTTLILKKDAVWYKVQSGNPQGAAYVEDFANNASIGADARDEANNGGGVSVKVGVGNWAGHNYHFWSTGSRATINVNEIIGVFTFCQARLITEDASKPDDRANCKNILQMGADWWLNESTGWLPDWSANSGIGGGRSKWITNDWQYFSMSTLPPDELKKNPPCYK